MKGRNGYNILVDVIRDSITTDIRNARNMPNPVFVPFWLSCIEPALYLRWVFVACLCTCGYNEESMVYNDGAFKP